MRVNGDFQLFKPLLITKRKAIEMLSEIPLNRYQLHPSQSCKQCSRLLRSFSETLSHMDMLIKQNKFTSYSKTSWKDRKKQDNWRLTQKSKSWLTNFVLSFTLDTRGMVNLQYNQDWSSTNQPWKEWKWTNWIMSLQSSITRFLPLLWMKTKLLCCWSTTGWRDVLS